MKRDTTLIFLMIGSVFTSCQPPTTDPEVDTLKQEVVVSYAELAFTIYNDAHGNAGVMRNKIDEFLAAPSTETLNAARQAWSSSRQIYTPTEVFRFYEGPIDGAGNLESRINGWPLDPAYVDYYRGNLTGGIIADEQAYPVISKQVLSDLNQKSGATKISTGWHVIEFLLFGEGMVSEGADYRPFTDYTTAPHAVRRRQYIKAVTELLLDDLAQVRDSWQPGAPYHTRFVDKSNTARSLGNIFQGMVALSRQELAQKQLAKPLRTKDPLDTQSPFSGIGAWDVVYSLKGIRSIYTGRYLAFDRGVKVYGHLSRLLNKQYPKSDQAILDQLAEVEKYAYDLTNPRPFIRVVQENPNGKIDKTIEALQKLSELLADAASKLNAKID